MFARLLVLVVVVALAWAVVARAGGAAGPERVYIVRSGDTLWSIAERTYGGDARAGVWKIEQRNRLDRSLRVGQRIVLPGG